MTPDSEELLSSMVDGDPVDPAQLTKALAEPDAAGVLIDFARIRAAVEGDDIRPSAGFYRSTRGAMRTARIWYWIATPVPLATAAVLILFAIAAGLWMGRLSVNVNPPTSPLMAYCTDARGIAYAPGGVMALDHRRVQCVLRGEWKVVSQ